jgi:hypothetical protein
MKRTGLSRVRAIAAKLDDTEEGTTYGFPAFKVRGKTFAWFPKKKEVEPGSLGVRMSILERDDLVAREPAIYYVTPHYRDYTSVLESSYEFILADEKRRKALKARLKR